MAAEFFLESALRLTLTLYSIKYGDASLYIEGRRVAPDGGLRS